MYIFIVSLICGILLGGVYYAVYGDAVNTVLVAFLLFVAIDTGLRAILDRPSWIIQLMARGKETA